MFDPTDDDPPAPAEEVPAEYDETDYFNLIPETVDDATDEEFARAQDGAYWQSAAIGLAQAEAQRILDSPLIAAARAHVRETWARWQEEARTTNIPF